jgi:hypothetical protein
MAVEVLKKIKDFLVTEELMSRDCLNILQCVLDLTDIKSRLSGYASLRFSGKIHLTDASEYHQNYSEPSPRAYTLQNQGSKTTETTLKDEKLLERKKKIRLHRQQIDCLKKQLREAESYNKTGLDINLIRFQVKKIIALLPKLDGKQEKEVEACLNLVGLNFEEYNKIKNSKFNNKRSKVFT